MHQHFNLITIFCSPKLLDLLIAEISNLGYNSFIIRDSGFQISVTQNEFNEDQLISLLNKYGSKSDIHYHVEHIEDKNWNEAWEKNYDPIIINDYCLIKASFHKNIRKFPIEVTINPKMSFGTGHHDTTYLMIENQLEINHLEKTVLDVGCGTGILSIIAEKLGASKVLGLDVDPSAYENALENIQINNSRNITIYQGDISSVPENAYYDILLANINRNTILSSFHQYHQNVCNMGFLVISGFFNEDVEILVREANKYQFGYLRQSTRNKWSSLVFQKKTK